MSSLKGTLVDPDAKKLKHDVLRFIWLDPDVSVQVVRSFLLQKGVGSDDIISVDYECDAEFGIRTGNIRAKIVRQKVEVMSKILGRALLLGQKIFVIRLGDPITCFFCNQAGHQKAYCTAYKESKNAICSKCNKKGHKGEECSLAKRIAPSKDGDESDDETIEDDNHDRPVSSGVGLSNPCTGPSVPPGSVLPGSGSTPPLTGATSGLIDQHTDVKNNDEKKPEEPTISSLAKQVDLERAQLKDTELTRDSLDGKSSDKENANTQVHCKPAATSSAKGGQKSKRPLDQLSPSSSQQNSAKKSGPPKK